MAPHTYPPWSDTTIAGDVLAWRTPPVDDRPADVAKMPWRVASRQAGPR